MSLRQPASLPTRQSAAVDVLEYELLQEKASTLSRVTQIFERALAAHLAAPEDPDLFAHAGEALWHFVIQRELCGLRNTEAVLREYRVPAPLRLRMGVTRRQRCPLSLRKP